MPEVPLTTGTSRLGQGLAHHGAALDQAGGHADEAAAEVDQVGDRGADGRDDIAGLAHGAAR